jgi:hypothetical protein
MADDAEEGQGPRTNLFVGANPYETLQNTHRIVRSYLVSDRGLDMSSVAQISPESLCGLVREICHDKSIVARVDLQQLGQKMMQMRIDDPDDPEVTPSGGRSSTNEYHYTVSIMTDSTLFWKKTPRGLQRGNIAQERSRNIS